MVDDLARIYHIRAVGGFHFLDSGCGYPEYPVPEKEIVRIRVIAVEIRLYHGQVGQGSLGELLAPVDGVGQSLGIVLGMSPEVFQKISRALG